jgi:hypothetical protein
LEELVLVKKVTVAKLYDSSSAMPGYQPGDGKSHKAGSCLNDPVNKANKNASKSSRSSNHPHHTTPPSFARAVNLNRV